jgi:hypothetical protein
MSAFASSGHRASLAGGRDSDNKRPMRVIIGAVVFAFGMLAGAGIVAWLMPPA